MKRANPCPGLAGGPPAGEADLPSAAVAEGGCATSATARHGLFSQVVLNRMRIRN